MRPRLLTLLLVLAPCLVAFGLVSPPAAAQPAAVHLNQVGFYPSGPKVAVVVGASEGPFYIVSTAPPADTVFTGTLGAPLAWSSAQQTGLRQADFSALRMTGRYQVVVPGVPPSPPFAIEPDALADVFRGAIRSYYYQRASTALPRDYAGLWTRPAGHLDNSVIVHPSAANAARPAGTRIAAPRGWYDAGDYNKYIVNSGITMYTLLALYEDQPAFLDTLALNLPESGNGLPDYLDEVLWNLRWMLTMQDPSDGGVYHKLTEATFSAFAMPHAVTAPRYIVQKSTPATLDFAAVMAQAARVFDDFEAEVPGLADSCRTAALDAWRWARANRTLYYRQGEMNQQYDPDIQTGEYGDGNATDEFRWAAAELYITTRADSFYTAYLASATSLVAEVPGWPQVNALGTLSLLRHRTRLTSVADTVRIKQNVLALGTSLLNRQMSGYGISMTDGDFYWGSNSVAANQSVMLLQAYLVSRDVRYLRAALANVDYLLGRNPTGYSYVTGFGTKSPRFPHHRPSGADAIAAPIPGFLVGGPNPDQSDNSNGSCTYPSNVRALSYTDKQCSYASNEVAINWNAPLVYVLGMLEALHAEVGWAVDAEAAPTPGADATGWLAPPYPNPTTGTVHVGLTLPRIGQVDLALIDVLGRTIQRRAIALPAGAHTLSFGLGDAPAGLYFVRLHAEGRTESQPLLYLR